MDFYGRNDITLGSFLERYCFRTSYQCPSQACSASMLQHVRRFVHYPGCVQVTLQLVDGVGSLPTNDHILMWSCCSLCSVVRTTTLLTIFLKSTLHERNILKLCRCPLLLLCHLTHGLYHLENIWSYDFMVICTA